MNMGRKLPDHSAMSSSQAAATAEDARLEALELMKVGNASHRGDDRASY